MSIHHALRAGVLACTSLTAASLVATPALAQDETAAGGGLQEIIVTAQKREQSVQDVPIAVTAVGTESLQANRVTNVVDLSAIAPGVTVRPSIGSSSIPSFTVRGAVSYGVVPGSDKQVSMYLDGVYLSSPRGAIFDLPNVERIEMLRGPQGTLFGRNATAGAVSISTFDPTGVGHVKAQYTIGNYDMRRFELTAQTPELGPLSAYFGYVHTQYRGDVKNLASMTFDRSTNALANKEFVTSSQWLGGKKSDTYFAALKFETGDFKTVYKFDHNDDEETPGAVAVLGLDTTGPGNTLTGPLIAALVSSNNIPIASNRLRPDAVYNTYNTLSVLFQEGHSLTSTYTANDHLSFKNIAAFRSSAVRATASLSGIDAVPFTTAAILPYAKLSAISALAGKGVNVADPANAALVASTIATYATAFAGYVGQPFMTLGSGPASRSKQWSDELQANYNSDLVTLTVGGLYFLGKDNNNEHGMQNTVSFTVVPGGVIPYLPGIGYNKARSIAAYAQGEFHVTPELDIVVGGRYTNDKKLAQLTSLTTATCPATITSSAALKNCPLVTSTYNYKGSKFNYLIGANYRPNRDILLYGKWSTAYVSGGKVGPITFDPETAKSAEAGIKADWLNHKLRTNLAVFWAQYKNYQTAQGGNTLGQLPEFIALVPDKRVRDALGTFVYPQGTVRAQGFELEVTAAPTDGVIIGGNLSYTDTKFTNVPGLLKAAAGLSATAPDSDYLPTLRPKWTASAFAQYTSQPIWGDTTFTARIQGNYQSKMYANANPNVSTLYPQYTATVPGYWLVNGRAALEHIDFGGVQGTLAVWGKNIFDNRSISFPFNQSGVAAATFIEPRRFGVDMTVEF